MTGRTRGVVTATDAPAAVGPYSQAVWAGDLLFLSGQIPLDPATGALVEKDFEARVTRVIQNIQAVLQAAGGGLSDVVKATVYLTNMGDFPKLNRVYAEHFSPPFPARTAIQVAALPLGTDIEMEVIAHLPGRRP